MKTIIFFITVVLLTSFSFALGDLDITPSPNNNPSAKVSDCIKNGDQAYKTRDFIQAMRWYLEAAKLGDVNGEIRVARLYASGQGVLLDEHKAMNWYLKAAQQGNANAEFIVGVLYHLGQGVAQNNKKALEWYLKSAKQGNTRAKEAITRLEKENQVTHPQ